MPISVFLSLEGATLRYEIEENVVTLRASEAVAQCIVIGPICGFVCVCVCVFVCLWVWLWVCYHDNSKLRASILTKLCL